MAKLNYSTFVSRDTKKQQTGETKEFKVKYFSLADDGDEATVRFIYNSDSEFDIETVHVIEVEGKQRRVSCLRTGTEPLHVCPLCESGNRVYDKMFVKLIQYVSDESGHIVAQAKVWERPAYFSKTLKDFSKEYGSLSENVFKIKRQGKKGDTKTTYNILFANPMIYKPEIYVKDFSAFKDFELNKFFFTEKTADEMREFLETGKFSDKKEATKIAPEVSMPNTQAQQSTSYSQAIIKSAVNVPPTTPSYSSYSQAIITPAENVPPTTQPQPQAQLSSTPIISPVTSTPTGINNTTTSIPTQESDPTSNRPRRYTF